MKGDDLRVAWGDFVSEVGERKGGWDWYGTLTFRERNEEERAVGWTRVGTEFANRSYFKWMEEVAEGVRLAEWCDRTGENEVYWFKALEMQRERGVPHVHCLVGGVGNARRDEAWRAWFGRYGFARIVPYDARLGARFYLCKYVTKELGEVGFSHNLNKIRQEVLYR